MTDSTASAQGIYLSHHCLPLASMEDRVAAAAAASVDGIGLNLRAYRRWREDSGTDAELADILGRHGQRLTEHEALHGWAMGDEHRRRAAADEELAYHLAETFGATYLQAIGPYAGTLADAIDAYGALCDRARVHGLTVGLEFLPFTNIPDLATAATIVEGADRDNGGVCVDAWHFFRGTPDVDALRHLPGDLIANVQLNDGPLEPEDSDYLRDCMTNRRCPGDGEFDLVPFVRAIAETGYRAPVSIEVISHELDRIPPTEATDRMVATTRRLLSKAEETHP